MLLGSVGSAIHPQRGHRSGDLFHRGRGFLTLITYGTHVRRDFRPGQDAHAAHITQVWVSCQACLARRRRLWWKGAGVGSPGVPAFEQTYPAISAEALAAYKLIAELAAELDLTVELSVADPQLGATRSGEAGSV
jgi:hypothetical protein